MSIEAVKCRSHQELGASVGKIRPQEGILAAGEAIMSKYQLRLDDKSLSFDLQWNRPTKAALKVR